MSTLEQHLRDHGIHPDDAAFYAAHAEKWLRDKAALRLGLGDEPEAAVLDSVAYESRDRADA